MPCHSAMTKSLVTVSPEDTVEDTLALMKKKKVESVAVVNEEQEIEGVFSILVLLKNLLPVTMPLSGAVQTDISIQAAPGIAKRLRKVGPAKMNEVMERRFHMVHPETPTWQGINMLVEHGPPLMVVEAESGKLVGMINTQSALEELERLRDSEE